MKKKMVKLLSIVMLLSMMFSMTVSGAYALVDDGSNSGSVIIGGTITSGTNVGGNLVIGATERPADDSPYDGVVAPPVSQDYTTAISEAAKANKDSVSAAIDAALKDAVKQYSGKEDGDYTGIVDSELPMVQANQDFLKYIRDNLDTVDKATLQTAIDLFGEDAVYGKEEEEKVDTDSAQEELYAVLARMSEIEDEYVAEHPEDRFCDGLLDDETSEYYQLYIKGEALARLVANPGISTLDLVDPTDPTKVSSKWSEVCGTGSSLASATESGGTLKFYKAFDICNSTDYRITIDLHGSTIDALATDAAFVIRDAGNKYGGTITFTNGTINGDGFYVYGGGVLNLGGLINTTKIDITVNAKTNAVYVDEGGTAVIGEGTTLNGWYYATSTAVVPEYSTSATVFIRNGGAVRMTGGTVNGSNNAFGAIYSAGGILEISSSVAEVRNEHGYNAIVAEGGSKVDIHAGVIYGGTGISVNSANTVLNINGGSITGYNKTISNNWPNTGAAITVLGDATSSGNSPYVYVNGGTLRSEYNAGVVNLTADGTRLAQTAAEKQKVVRIAVDDVNVTIQEAHGMTSDYAKVAFLVKSTNTTGYQALKDAIAAANAVTSGKASITMISNYTMTAADVVAISSAADQLTINGNGHTLFADGVDALTIDGAKANVVIENICIDGSHVGSGIVVKSGKAYIGDEVYVDHFINGLYVVDGAVTVNGLDVDDDTTYGISCAGGKTTVIMCKIDADNPVNATPDRLLIEGGWFLYKSGPKIGENSTPVDANLTVATYVDPDVSYVKYVEKDRYYEVLFNDTPTVEIVSGATGYESNGVPYVKYDKGDPTPIIFNVMPAVTRITAVSKSADKTSYNIFTAEAGKSGNIRIPDTSVLKDCPAGAYDLQFTFKNGYVIKAKLSLFVFPKVAVLFDVPNTIDYTTETTNINVSNALKSRLVSDNIAKEYDVYSQHNVAVVMSELPDKICIGNDPTGAGEILLENFINKVDSPTFGKILTGNYAGNYIYYISYADLNNLSVGQNYAFLEWDGIDGALVRLPLTVANSNVSISPAKQDWTKIDTYANFTVKPSVDTVYIDGEKVDDGYWTYNKDTNVLSIKGVYLNALTSKEHNLEVITPMGKVSATLNTGIGLRAKGVDYHVYGGAKAMSFVASDKINRDAGIWIGSSNPTRLDPSAYSWDSETGFTLSAAFLNRLALGTYYISAYVFNGTEYQYTTTTFRVISASQASYNPSTGDNSNIFVWLVILVLSAVAIVVIILPRMRKKTTR